MVDHDIDHGVGDVLQRVTLFLAFVEVRDDTLDDMLVPAEKDELILIDDQGDILIIIEQGVLFILYEILENDHFEVLTLLEGDTLIFVMDIFEETFGEGMLFEPCDDLGIVHMGKDDLLATRIKPDLFFVVEAIGEDIHDAAFRRECYIGLYLTIGSDYA
jgi:hypothetical protein